MPVSLNVQVPGRLAEPVEIAAYYTVAEALTNIAKHARASAVEVEVTAGSTTGRPVSSAGESGLPGTAAAEHHHPPHAHVRGTASVPTPWEERQ